MAQTFHKHVLANGLTVIAEVDPDSHTSSAGFFVKTGARDEDSAVMGVSHFLEHMMFKGFGAMEAEALNKAFDEVGARNNAYTSNEVTCFYAHALPEHLPRITELLGRMMRPALRESDFTTEKGVILEEIAMYKDNPFWVLYEAAIERHYSPHPMSHRVLGTTETITALSRDQMKAYFDTRYSADNTVAAFAGRMDFDRTVKEVEALCGGWARTGATRQGLDLEVAGGEFEIRDEKVNRGYLLALARGPGVEDDRRYAAALLTQVLGAADNSRLHWALVESGVAEEAQAAYDPHDGVGEYYVYASCDPERLDHVWGIVRKEMAALVDSVTEDDLVRLRNKIATGATLGAERPGDRMQRIGRLWTSRGVYTTLDEELAKINSVKIQDLRDLAREFPLMPATIGRMVPKGV